MAQKCLANKFARHFDCCKSKTTGIAGGSKKALALRSPAAAEGSLVQREAVKCRKRQGTEGLYS